MYTIGRIPTVFSISMAINQYNWLFLADFHKAIPFQIASQIINGVRMINKFSGVIHK